MIWKILFFCSAFIIFFNYAGYAIIAAFLNQLQFRRIKKKPELNNDPPPVSFIVAAYNEQECIEEKIKNTIEQNYPAEKIEIIFITDGSTDKTTAIIERYQNIKLLHKPERKGKSAALNRAVSFATNNILIFSDSNTILNPDAIKNIAKHYSLKDTGGVAGEKKVINLSSLGSGNQVNEGLYWKYESFLKKIDSDFYSVVGAAGELFSVRKDLYEAIPENVILDDFVLSLKVASKGYRIVYEPDAFAAENPSFSIKDEKKRKIRIGAGGFQAILLLKSLFKFWKYPRLSYLYFSHRFLRWAVTPFCFLMLFISNLSLFISTGGVFTIIFIAQFTFYFLALIGAIFPGFRTWLKPAQICYYIVFMNYSVILGLFRFINGSQSAIWEKAKRSS